MSESLAKYLDTFAGWLRTLGEDAEHLGAILETDGVGQPAREAIAGGLNYLFKSLDLIPDGIDDIGYLDDAFVLRVAASLAMESEDESKEGFGPVAKLASDCETLREFLEADYPRLETYAKGLRRGAARGRAVSDVIENATIRADFLSDVRGFAKTYEVPGFSRDEKNLLKLKAFLNAKLPK